MKASDRIVLIDGRTTVNMSTDEAASKMRGPKGTAVVVTVERGKEKTRKQFRLVRDVIKVPSVRGEMLAKGVGYVRIASFTATTADDLERNLTKLEGEGMKGLVLDLRFNPGGLLNSAVDVLNRFIDQGPLLHVVGRGSAKQSFLARPGLMHPDYPVVVLVNGGSASAAEIVAGALQDTHRAIVLGTKSFGKGSVQTIYPLNDGSALSLMTQKWLTSGGHSISQKGIMPDVVVKNPGDDEMEAELEKLREERKQTGSIDPQATKKQSDKPATSTASKAAEEKDAKGAAEEDTRDYQLEKAQEIIAQQLQGKKTR
jgi:carboxyl-terminal processing protease